MSVRFITQALLANSMFIEATEQAGAFWDQPAPATDNKGFFKPVTVGSAYTLVYSGSVTETGSYTALRDSFLAGKFGDGWPVGGQVRLWGTGSGTDPMDVTSTGADDGELIWANSATAIASGDGFNLEINYKDRDFRIQILDGGDVGGDATFKWSHDGGTTYLGRDEIDQADFLGATMVESYIVTVDSQSCVLGQAANGSIHLFSHRVPDNIYRRTSTDGGLTWSGVHSAWAGINPPHCMLTNVAGRMLSYGGMGAGSSYVYYSDDHGESWSFSQAITRDLNQVIQLLDGRYGAVYEYLDVIYYLTSEDGFTWNFEGTVVETAATGTRVNVRPSLVQCDDGRLIAVYETDRDVETNFEIKYRTSDDGGVTWSSRADIFTYSVNYRHPRLFKDIQGDIYCICTKESSPKSIVAKKSTDNGDNWGTEFDVITDGADDLTLPYPALIDGHMLMINYRNNTDRDSYVCRRGLWETVEVTSNAPCALYPAELPGRMHLVAGAHIAWNGAGSVAGDNWTFDVAYTYGMTNLVDDSPTRPWRSLEDNKDVEIVLDLGTYYTFPINAVGLFNTNIRYARLQTATAATYNSSLWLDTYLYVNELICADLIAGNSGGVHASNWFVANSYIERTHQYNGHDLQWRSGDDLGIANEIRDNDMGIITVDENDDNSWDADDPYTILNKSVTKRLYNLVDEKNTVLVRFVRLLIPAQATYEGYYEIGNLALGIAVDCGFPEVGYGLDNEWGIDMLRSSTGGIFPMKRYGRKRKWALRWPNNADDVKKILGVLDFAQGAENMVYIPDDTLLMDDATNNIIQDPNFSTLSYWEAGNNASLTNPSSGHYTSKACLITENDTTNPQLKQTISVNPSKSYHVAWHSKADGGNYHHVKVWEDVRSIYLDDGLQVNSDYAGRWARHAFPFTTPFDVNTVTLIWEVEADSGSGDSLYINGLVHCYEMGKVTDCYLTKLVSTAEQEHILMDRFNLEFELEEVL